MLGLNTEGAAVPVTAAAAEAQPHNRLARKGRHEQGRNGSEVLRNRFGGKLDAPADPQCAAGETIDHEIVDVGLVYSPGGGIDPMPQE